MTLFKKKVSIKDYCHGKFDFVFSQSGKNKMNEILEVSGVSLSGNLAKQYYDHFIAVYFRLIMIAFSRNISRELRYEAMDIAIRYLSSKNADNIEHLSREYGSAFGSSFDDGIAPMATLFVKNVRGGINSDIAKHFYSAFYEIIGSFMNELHGIKIVH